MGIFDDAANGATATGMQCRRRRTWPRTVLTVGIVGAAIAVTLCPRLLPQPTDARGQMVLSIAAVSKVYWQLLIHSLGLRPGSIDGPEVSEATLASAPPSWTLESLPELNAGVDFSTQLELLVAFAPFRNMKPVVIRNFLTHENASAWAGTFIKMKNPWWTLEYLRDRIGNAEVRVFDNYTDDDSIVWRKFYDYADDVMSDPNSIMYARAISEMWDTYPEMLDALDQRVVSDLAGRPWPWGEVLDAVHARLGLGILFVSGSKPTTKLHADLGESFVMHTEGLKLWRFFGSENFPLLTPQAMVKNLGFVAGFDVFTPDFVKQPWLRLARGWDAEIRAGDLLYFPSQTFHGVRNLAERNVAVDMVQFELLRSFRNNWFATMVLLLHPSPPIDFLRYCFLDAESLDGHRLPRHHACLKEIYFQTYGAKPTSEQNK
eukprot:TRINITY_DN4005_c0_g2_i1.p1 TRINITY_DN4005_c0_g2~~TRINITY_DN4005_c0_g2_i1.p1  ORF type:complete len:432 (-),score=53.47 TRINITY_DN4005_c0_g2_i1:56-1351(-)